MYVAEERNEMTPAHLVHFLTSKPPVGAAIILRMKPGYVLIAVGKKGCFDEPFVNFEGVPLLVVTNDLTADQWQQTVKDGQDYFARHGPLTAFRLIIELKTWLETQPAA